MRLLNVKTLELEEIFDSSLPSYAILSHTWGLEEISFQEWKWDESDISSKEGFQKIRTACQQADRDGYMYLWCDTNCINKDSSAELAEAINSMYTWYENAAVCYVYLSDTKWFPATDDLSVTEAFVLSRWITRGWTLQELLAPSLVKFFDYRWRYIGTRDTLARGLSCATNISIIYLNRSTYNKSPVRSASADTKMWWLAERRTTRIEDMAYCMLGIFGVNMPPIYGEGNKAFLRLQEEIIKSTHDHSIFCWYWDPKYIPRDWTGLLSPTPKVFYGSFRGLYPRRDGQVHPVTYTVINGATSICLPCLHSTHFSILQLDVIPRESEYGGEYPCLVVRQLGTHAQEPFWYRLAISESLVFLREPIENPPGAFLFPHQSRIIWQDQSSFGSKRTELSSIAFLFKTRNSATNNWRFWPDAKHYYGEWDETEGRFYLAAAPGFPGISRGVLSINIPRMVIDKNLKGERKWGGKRLTIFFASIWVKDGLYQVVAEVIPEPKSGFETAGDQDTGQPCEWRLSNKKEDAKYKQKFEALTEKTLSPHKFDGRCFLDKVLVFDLSKVNSLRERFVDRDKNYVHMVQFCPPVVT